MEIPDQARGEEPELRVRDGLADALPAAGREGPEGALVEDELGARVPPLGDEVVGMGEGGFHLLYKLAIISNR